MKKGITAHIYRDTYNCVLNKFNDLKTVTVICDGGVFEPREDAPEVTIIKRDLSSSGKYPNVSLYLHAEPTNILPGEHFAFGGSFIYSSDARFPSKYPIPLHDRRMNLE